MVSDEMPGPNLVRAPTEDQGFSTGPAASLPTGFLTGDPEPFDGPFSRGNPCFSRQLRSKRCFTTEWTALVTASRWVRASAHRPALICHRAM